MKLIFIWIKFFKSVLENLVLQCQVLFGTIHVQWLFQHEKGKQTQERATPPTRRVRVCFVGMSFVCLFGKINFLSLFFGSLFDCWKVLQLLNIFSFSGNVDSEVTFLFRTGSQESLSN